MSERNFDFRRWYATKSSIFVHEGDDLLCLTKVGFQRSDLGSKIFFHALAGRVFSPNGVLRLFNLSLQHSDVCPETLDDPLGLLAFTCDHRFTLLNRRLQSADPIDNHLLKLLHVIVQTRSSTIFYSSNVHGIGFAMV